MLAELFVAFPALHRIAGADGAVGAAVLDAMFPAAAYGADAARAQEERLRDTRMAQPALGIAGFAMHHLLRRLGIEADMYAGHSYGELVALAAAGTFSADTLLSLSAARAEAILAAAGDDPGGMAAVAAGAEQVEQVLSEKRLSGRVVVANHNAPGQVVISGETAQLDIALDAIRAAGLAAKKVPVACAVPQPCHQRSRHPVRRSHRCEQDRCARASSVDEQDGIDLSAQPQRRHGRARRSGRRTGQIRRAGRGDVRRRCQDLRRGRARPCPQWTRRQDPRWPTAHRCRLRRLRPSWDSRLHERDRPARRLGRHHPNRMAFRRTRRARHLVGGTAGATGVDREWPYRARQGRTACSRWAGTRPAHRGLSGESLIWHIRNRLRSGGTRERVPQDKPGTHRGTA
ncbi:MAG: acyltransferase domain-containing protein [Haloechinothrix sp.]